MFELLRFLYKNPGLLNGHYAKNGQMRSIFWSIFSCIQSKYGKIRTRENTLFRQFSRSGWNSNLFACNVKHDIIYKEIWNRLRINRIMVMSCFIYVIKDSEHIVLVKFERQNWVRTKINAFEKFRPLSPSPIPLQTRSFRIRFSNSKCDLPKCTILTDCYDLCRS